MSGCPLLLLARFCRELGCLFASTWHRSGLGTHLRRLLGSWTFPILFFQNSIYWKIYPAALFSIIFNSFQLYSIIFFIVFNCFQLFSIIFNCFQLFSIVFNYFQMFSIVFNYFVQFVFNYFQLLSIVFYFFHFLKLFEIVFNFFLSIFNFSKFKYSQLILIIFNCF